MRKKKRVALKRAVRETKGTRRRASAKKAENSDSADIERAVYDGMQDLRQRSG